MYVVSPALRDGRGGSALYLLGLMACGIRVRHRIGWPPVVALVMLLAAVPLMTGLPGIAASAFVLVVLVALAIMEHMRAHADSVTSGTAPGAA